MKTMGPGHFKKRALPYFVGLALLNTSAIAQEGSEVEAAETSNGDATQNSGFVEEVFVTGVRQSQAKAIDLKRNADNVIDSIVAEDIGKLPDTTITDSLQRVTGVQISREAGEGTTLNVRGMPQVLTTMNGEQFLSPWSITGVQANFSDIPASMISGVDVYKSQSASTLAGGISGVVDLKTLDPRSLDAGFTTRLRLEGGVGSLSQNSDADPDPDKSAALVIGYNSDDRFAVVANFYGATAYAANYSMFENTRLAFLDQQGGTPGDPLDLDGDGDLVNDWYLVPEEYGARSSFVDRDRLGASLTGTFEISPEWSVRGDVFYSGMEQYNRSVKAAFNGRETPLSYGINGEPAERLQDLYDVLQPGSVIGSGTTVSYEDGEGNSRTSQLHTLRVAEIWAADFQTTSENEIDKTAAINSSIEVNYDNGSGFEASFRGIYANAEKQYRKATFQQGTPGWLWVDEDGTPGKDPLDGYHATIDYRGDYPKFTFSDDLSDANLLKQYQGFAEGYNTDADLAALRGDFSLEFDHTFARKLSGGVRYGVRSADYNKFFYVTPTGRYTNWEDPRVPADKRYRLLPGNLIWQKYPDWLKFNYAEENSSLIDIGGLQDNGFSAADTVSFSDFGPIKGFEAGVASLDPAQWDNPYEFMNRLYPGTRTVDDPGYTYSVEEASTSGYMQLDFGNEDSGLFGIPYRGNLGVQIVKTDRTVDKSVVPEVLDSFNSIGYDDWQKIAYVYETETHKNSNTEILPSANINLFPHEDWVVRAGVAKTVTRNDLENVGSSVTLWYSRCTKTDENGDVVYVLDPSTGGQVPDDVGCVGGGSDNGRPDIEPWSALVWNTSAEWYFSDDAILGLGMFLIQVDTAVESFQEKRFFADLDGIDRNRVANIWTTQNVGASDLYGLEFGYKQPFSFVSVPVINAMGVEFNYTYSQSETETSDIEGNVLPLVSNSEHQTNFILWYDQAGLNVRLAYNWRSEEYLGHADVNSNVTVMKMAQWLEPTGYLDLSINYWFNEHVNLFVNGTNLTEESRKSYAQFEDQFSSIWVQEARYSFGVNLSI